MSYMTFQQQCKDCFKSWNAAFGIVNNHIIAQAPTECPHCGSPKIEKIAEGWSTPVSPEVSS